MLDIECAQLHEDQEQPERQEHVANAGYHERLESRPAIGAALVVIADQAIAAEADTLPAEEQQQQVVSQHQQHHAEHKQVHPGVEAGNAFLTGHVPGGEEVNQETHTGNH